MKKEDRIALRARLDVLTEKISEAYEHGAISKAKALEMEYCDLLIARDSEDYIIKRK